MRQRLNASHRFVCRPLVLRLSLCLITITGIGPGARAEVVERRLVAMGTVLNLRVSGESREAALQASEAGVVEVARIEALLSTWKPGGPLDRLNHSRPGEPVEVGWEASDLLTEVLAWSARTDGAFDPTVAPLMRVWDLRGSGRVPAPSEIAHALAAVGPNRISVDRLSGQASRQQPDAGIDEGAWGKGYALDRAAAAIEKAGSVPVAVDLGGQILVRGSRAVAIADPRARGRVLGSVSISDASVSTSGNSERGLTADGLRIGHLLDPRTGSPAPDFGSATAVAPSAFVADILSTAFFVLGPEKGLALSEKLKHHGIANEALFLVWDGDRTRAMASPELHFQSEEVHP
jgi:FAD:protein FMN transferase